MMGWKGERCLCTFRELLTLYWRVNVVLNIDSQASVHTPGSGYVLLHHVMGETDGERGVWSYVSELLNCLFI